MVGILWSGPEGAVTFISALDGFFIGLWSGAYLPFFFRKYTKSFSPRLFPILAMVMILISLPLIFFLMTWFSLFLLANPITTIVGGVSVVLISAFPRFLFGLGVTVLISTFRLKRYKYPSPILSIVMMLLSTPFIGFFIWGSCTYGMDFSISNPPRWMMQDILILISPFLIFMLGVAGLCLYFYAKRHNATGEGLK